MTKTKPVVKYRRSTFTFCGQVHKVRYKLTLLATFNGELAKKIRDVSSDGGLYWSYYNTKGKERLEIYEDQKLEDKIVAKGT
jgi:hypothetical protein